MGSGLHNIQVQGLSLRKLGGSPETRGGTRRLIPIEEGVSDLRSALGQHWLGIHIVQVYRYIAIYREPQAVAKYRLMCCIPKTQARPFPGTKTVPPFLYVRSGL